MLGKFPLNGDYSEREGALTGDFPPIFVRLNGDYSEREGAKTVNATPVALPR